MLKSMTGFGQAEGDAGEEETWSVPLGEILAGQEHGGRG